MLQEREIPWPKVAIDATEARMTDLWALVCNDTGKLIGATDCAGEPFLFYTSLEDAVTGAQAHLGMFNIDCRPVRLHSN